tara:strand:- start:179 stop:313 length:135 start_codon:yes stop_codon:yes gene_type:complete
MTTEKLKVIIIRELGWAVLRVARVFGWVNLRLHKLAKRILDAND